MSVSLRLKKFIKVLTINFAILLIFLFSPALLLRLFKKSYPRLIKTTDERAYYPTYENNQFSIQLLNEKRKLKTSYKSFIGWTKEKVNFKYTNIEGPYNVRKSKGEAINNSVWFFGGSTMWGVGASDSQTIPSHFNSLTNMSVYNFGQGGWNSRQSLNQLINAIGDNNNPSVVIFYDGVNDIQQCRSEIKILPAHVREKTIQNKLRPLRILFKNKISEFILSPYIAVGNKFFIKKQVSNVVNSKQFNCDTNQEKARLIAQHLVNNWRTAYALSRSNGFKFYGILQPTLFTTETNSEYFSSRVIKLNSQYEIQYNVVYPLIIKEIQRYCVFDKDFCSSIINGSNWLNGTNNIFIDFCHVNSLGNKLIAKEFTLLLKGETDLN